MFADDPLTDSMAASLGSLPKLRLVDIYADISDEALVLLCASRSIEELRISHCDKVTERGFAAMESLPLNKLQLGGRRSTTLGSVFEHLAHIKSLRDVSVDVKAVTDEQLAWISEMTWLEQLNLDGWYGGQAHALSREQHDWLQSRLPNATIEVW